MGHFNTQSGGISTLMAPQAIEDGAKLIFDCRSVSAILLCFGKRAFFGCSVFMTICFHF